MKLHLDDEPIADINRVAMRPGDIIVAETGQRLTDQEFDAIRGMLKATFPDNPVLVCEAIHLNVVSPVE